MKLTAPKTAIFLIAVILAILAGPVRYTAVYIPVVSAHSFDVLFIGFVLLAAGVLLRGL